MFPDLYDAASKGKAATMTCPAHIERGKAVRRALLSVARTAHAKRMPMPTYDRLGAALGVCKVQVWRHMATLIEAGDITIIRERHKRIWIEGVRQ